MSAVTTRATPATSTATAVVGIVGGGQLARMTHQAAIGLGIDVVVLTPDADDPAVTAGARHLPGAPDDEVALRALAACCDVVTLDHELVPRHHLQALVDAGHAVRPGPTTLALAQDKALARRQLADAGFPVPAFEVVDAGDAGRGGPLRRGPTGGPIMLQVADGRLRRPRRRDRRLARRAPAGAHGRRRPPTAGCSRNWSRWPPSWPCWSPAGPRAGTSPIR